MLIENTYTPLIHLSPSMVAKYLYVVTFRELIPTTVTFYNTDNHLITEPLLYQNGIALFEPTGVNFTILYTLPESAQGGISVQEGLMEDNLQLKRKEDPS